MKTDKIIQKTTQSVINQVQSTPVQRVKLEQKPDIVDIPKKKQTFWEMLKAEFGVYRSNLNKATVKELKALPFNEFLNKAYEISSDSTGIPKNLRAPVVFSEMDSKIAMAYGVDTNIIVINKNLKTKNRKVLFSCFKHEHRHQLQNFNIMRTEGLGEEYIKILAQKKTDLGLKTFVSAFREMPVEKLEELKPQLGENFDLVKRYQAAVAQGQDAENAFLKEAADKDYKIFFEEFKNFRAKVVDEMGIIPANSKDAEKSKELFDSILGADQNALTSAKTIIRPHEIDAYRATGFSYWEFMLARFIK